MESKSKHINKFVYYFSLLTWMTNVCFIFIPFFFDVSSLWVIGIFVSVFIQGLISGAFSDEILVPQTTEKYKAIDYCLIISKCISISLMVIGFASLLIGGGGPEMIDGRYCLVNHGDIVRYVSDGWYIYFCICELALFTCGMLFFSTYMSLRIRALYVIQQSAE